MTEYGCDTPYPTKFKLNGTILGIFAIIPLLVYSIRNSKNMNEPSFLLLTENVIIYALKPTAKYAG
jgi:hypothetical protein